MIKRSFYVGVTAMGVFAGVNLWRWCAKKGDPDDRTRDRRTNYGSNVENELLKNKEQLKGLLEEFEQIKTALEVLRSRLETSRLQHKEG